MSETDTPFDHHESVPAEELSGGELDRAVAYEVMDEPDNVPVRKYSKLIDAAMDAWEPSDPEDVVMLRRNATRTYTAGPAREDPSHISDEYEGDTAAEALCRALVALARQGQS